MKFLALFAAACLCVAAAAAGTAGAADPKPAFNGCGLFKKDSDKDASDTVADPAPDEVEIENAWVQYDAAKGADAATLNVTIKNLSGEVPPPATSVTYNAIYSIKEGVTNFVRAHVDFTGTATFEYGHTEPLGTSTRYAYDGPTKGRLFTGEHGVAQIVFPAEAGGKPGTTLKGITAQTQLGRTTFVPGAVSQSPSRGLSFQDDDLGIGTFNVNPCAVGPTTGGGAAPPPSTPAAPPSGQAPSRQTAGPLPVKLVTKSVKGGKKALSVKLRSSEPLTGLGARLSRGSKAFGSGKLAKLDGNGTLRLKLAKKPRKGAYALDIAGTDSQGRRRIASFKLKIK
jgi:hypothetical protein